MPFVSGVSQQHLYLTILKLYSFIIQSCEYILTYYQYS